MPHIHEHMVEDDETILEALEAHSEKICDVLARAMGEPVETVAMLPKPWPRSVHRAAHNVDRLELEAYTGDPRRQNLSEEDGDVAVLEVMEIILASCPLMRNFQWGLWIRSDLVWGYARHEPDTRP